MKIKSTLLLLAAFMAMTVLVRAQADTNALPPELITALKSLKYQSGDITLHGGLAKLSLPKEFNFLASDDAETVLVKIWGNLPSEQKSLGMLMPAGMTPISSNAWAVTIDYTDDGYVKDDDASKINYDDLLKKMKAGIAEQNKLRKEKGYPTIELVGWAAPPHYDAATHKLYWAKELKVDGALENTLNYDIRILGRRGVLVLGAIAGMSQLPEIRQQVPQILAMVDFNEGSRYTDFDPKIDKVATYGIAALVAGGIAAKLGLFKLLLVGLVAAKKFIVIGVVALSAWVRKFFKKRPNPPAA